MPILRPLACCLVLCSTVAAQEKTGKPYIDMDYGPFLSMTIEAPEPKGNIAYKGVMVTLDKPSNTYALFDKDLLRYSAAWTGGKIDWRSVVYDGSHNSHPKLVGEQLFGNAVRPGWSIDGNFDDPRERPHGPLAHKHARYKGLYLNGEHVVFHYTVGDATVREMPDLETAGDRKIITRTIEIDKSPHDLTLHIVDRPPGAVGDQPRSFIGDKTLPIAVLGKVKNAAPAAKAPITPGNGLSARWTFDGALDRETTGGATSVAGRTQKGLRFNGRIQATPKTETPIEPGGKDYSIAAWVKTKTDGTVIAHTSAGKWTKGGRSLFIHGGRLTLDIGWVGAINGRSMIADGRWHHVAVTHNAKNRVVLYVDGEIDGRGRLESIDAPEDSRIVFGRTSDDFPRGGANRFRGDLDDVCIYSRTLKPDEVAAMAPVVRSENPIAVAVVNRPDAASWSESGAGIRLNIPATSTPARFKVLVWTGPAAGLKEFTTTAKASPKPENLNAHIQGGSTRFPNTITTRGKRSRKKDAAYVIDELTPPYKNEWNSWMRFGGFDFFEDSSKAAICTWNGDVWIVSGINDSLEELTWKRIATGMFQPLGLKIVRGDIYVTCRDQITILRDLNNDGEADYYENFNNDHQVTQHFHEFAMDLQTDAAGNFYYAKSARHALDSVVPHHGTLIRVSPDGKSSEIVCNGFRAANGVGIGPNGELSTSDQEGHWTPANRINLVKQDGFYGNMYSFHRSTRPTTYEPPVVWLPKNVDRSPAESLWVTSSKWGPLSGNMISTSYGTGQVFLVPYERVNGVYQGGAVRFPLDFPTGTMRARFHPEDGQLYLCGLFGWSSNKTLPGGFYRVRYTGKPVNMPVEFKAASNGVAIKFSSFLDESSAQDVANFGARQWNYRWTKNYGSKHYKVSNPKQEGADEVVVRSATLLADKRTVFLEIDDFKPVMQMQISWSLRNSRGERFRDDFYATVNTLGPKFDVTSTRPADIAATKERAAGLIQEILTNGKPRDARISRIAATLKDSTSAFSPFLDLSEQSTVKLSGFLKVRQPGRYSLHMRSFGSKAVLRVRGDATLRADNTASTSAIKRADVMAIDLPRGEIPISVEVSGAQQVLVEWKSEAFDWEPIPPSALRHDASKSELMNATQLRETRNLFASRGCVKCHSLPDELDISKGMPELRQSAPNLANASARFRAGWVKDWILDPAAMRHDATMPKTLHGKNQAEIEADAADIAAYLATLGDAADDAPDAIEGGEELFESLGCIACHSTVPQDGEDEFNRRSLHHVDRKYHAAALKQFLKAPHEHHAWRRMPDFDLADDEATKLTSWLRAKLPDAKDAPTEGDPRRGRILFGSVGCSNCHSTKAEQRPLGEMLSMKRISRGCLATQESKRGDAPDFGFTAKQSEHLGQFVSTQLPSLTRHVPAESAERAIKLLNCNACHTRDEHSGAFPEIFAEESLSGRLPESIPPLTWAGEKFNKEWMAGFISNKNRQRLRPHLRIRMPRFGADYGNIIAHGLAAQHGIQADTTSKQEAPDAELSQIGKKLVGKTGGFNCMQCHGFKGQKPTAAFDALGVDLEQIPRRIRRPFFDRWMLDPTRIDQTTKMPRLTTDGKTTSLRNTLNGDARKQFDAIWKYIQSTK